MTLPIYAPKVIERAEWALPVDSKNFEQVRALCERGAPAGAGWAPFEVALLRKQGGRAFKESDCPWWGSHVMVCRPAAVKALSGLIERDAELLPLLCADADLMLLNVWRSLDALDLERSQLRRLPNSGAIMKIESHVFKDEVIDGHAMFRLSARPFGSIYVQQPIVDAINNAGLREVDFNLVSLSALPKPSPSQPRMSVSLNDITSAADEDVWNVIYQALIPRVLGTPDEQYAVVKSWTKGLQMLWATQLVDDEVGNGGFNQYFYNSSGRFAMEAIDGFELIGSHERADLVRRAVDQLFRDVPRLREFYEQATVEAFMESYKHTDLGTIDDAWVKAPEFFTARTRYIREHPEEFVVDITR